MRRAVFLDRDGVINPMGKHVHTPEDFELIPGVAEALYRLSAAGYKLLLVTNQAGVAFGHLTPTDVGRIHQKMMDMLFREARVQFTDILACYDHPKATVAQYRSNSNMRKPRTGMFELLLERHRLDPANCIMVGDRNTDIIPARKLGMVTYYVGPEDWPCGGADYKLPSLVEVAEHILKT